jgi:hypothetical protein
MRHDAFMDAFMEAIRIDTIERRAEASAERNGNHAPEQPADTENTSAGFGRLLRLDTFFGVVAESPDNGGRQSIVRGIVHHTPQRARNSLIHHLWLAARYRPDDRAHRRRAKAGMRMLQESQANDLVVHGTRYRVVRAEGYVRLDAPGRGEPPVDPRVSVTHPLAPRGEGSTALDYPYFLNPALLTPPGKARRRRLPDSRYRDAFFLPWRWPVVRRSGDGWIPVGIPGSTPRSAVLGSRPFEDLPLAEKRLPVGHPVRAAYDQAVPALVAADRTYRGEIRGHTHVICPIRRLLHWGPDGPEPPRPSDPDVTPPLRGLPW